MKYIKTFENIEWDWIDQEYPDKPDLYLLQYGNGMIFYLSETDPINTNLILYKNYNYKNDGSLFRIKNTEIINKIINDDFSINVLNNNSTKYSEISKEYNIIF
jgi:hypothetical protein